MVAGASPPRIPPQPAGQQAPVGHGQQGPGLMVIALCHSMPRGLAFLLAGPPLYWAEGVDAGGSALRPAAVIHAHGSGAK